jgi:lysophospholipase L1-like esterase
MGMKRTGLRISACALATVGALVVAASASAAGPYISLGDSVGAAYGASTPDKGFVKLLYASFQVSPGADQLRNHAMAGATSAGMQSSQLPSALAEINDPSDTQAVTLEIGGNDFLQGLCNANWDPAGCQYRSRLASSLDQLKAALDADPGAEPFAVMLYYNPATGEGGINEANYDTQLLGANGVASVSDTGGDVGLNDVILQEATSRGIAVADAYPAFKAAGQSFIANDHLHPNDAGHQAIADAFCAALAPTCTASGPPKDVLAPETGITTKPRTKLKTRKKRVRVRFAFDSSEAGSTFTCRLDDKPAQPCTSPYTVKVGKGRHTFAVVATDAAGNADDTPATSHFKVVRKKKRHGHGHKHRAA